MMNLNQFVKQLCLAVSISWVFSVAQAEPLSKELSPAIYHVKNLNIGELINKTRNYQNISMNKLAKLADVSQSSLSRIESGTNYPTFDVLERIITALGFSLAEFFSEEKQNIDPSITRLLQVAKRLTVEEREALIHYLTIRLKE